MLCAAAGFDRVLIETVGVGQTELEIVGVADQVLVLLVPESLAVSQREADCAEEHGEWFQRLGFELQRLGEESLAIRQIPALLKQAEATQLVRDVLAEAGL